MPIPERVKQFLEINQVSFEVVPHPHAPSANRTAQAAHVPGDRLIKAVVLKDEGGYLVAVLPATRRLKLARLHRELGRSLGLATESELGDLFQGCEPGAVPALALAYGVDTVLDISLVDKDPVYLEAGDHESLIRLAGDRFLGLVGGAPRGDFSEHL